MSQSVTKEEFSRKVRCILGPLWVLEAGKPSNVRKEHIIIGDDVQIFTRIYCNVLMMIDEIFTLFDKSLSHVEGEED